MSSLTSLNSNYAKSKGLLMIGLDGAGKTTLLYKLKFNKTVTTISTIGFNCETIERNDDKISIWDIGGSKTIRIYWKSFLIKCQGLIFVVDSTNNDRFHECRKELENMLSENEVSKFPILILANKQDDDKAATQETISDALNLASYKDRKLKIIKTSGWTSDGLWEGMEWIMKQIKS